MKSILTHLALLGHKVRDRISNAEGIVTSVTFDLYGCIQAIVDPGLDKDGKQRERHWFDVSRLEILNETPVMAPPDFTHGDVAAGLKGPAEKPAAVHLPIPALLLLIAALFCASCYVQNRTPPPDTAHHPTGGALPADLAVSAQLGAPTFTGEARPVAGPVHGY